MLDTFNPQTNLNEWIQNDWESDDFDEREIRANMERIWERNCEASPHNWKYNDTESVNPLWLAFAILGHLAVSPFFWVAMILLILIYGR